MCCSVISPAYDVSCLHYDCIITRPVPTEAVYSVLILLLVGQCSNAYTMIKNKF